MRIKAFVAAAVGGTLVSSAAMADTTIKLLHLQDNPGIVGLWTKIAKDFEAANPGVKVQLQYLENEALKAKLPTLLQSSDRPNLFQSWSGGVMQAQYKAGLLEDITAQAGDLEKLFPPNLAKAFVIDGKVVGAPYNLSEVAFFYNKALFSKAGVTEGDVKTWDGFLAAVKKIKGAGITPICLGGGDKWPVHFYWSYLVLRAGGANVLLDAEAGKDGGFKNTAFVEAGERLKQLAALDPFQKGWLGDLFPASTGQFGDGVGAMDLMGNWLLAMQGPNAANGKGIPGDQIGLLAFPTLPGGKGRPTDTLGGTEGLLITKGSPKEALEFLKFFSTKQEQDVPAAKGIYVPAVKGTETALKDPLLLAVARNVAASTWHQNFFDQDLGPSVGRVVNDVSVAIAAGQMTPADGAAQVQQAWDQR